MSSNLAALTELFQEYDKKLSSGEEPSPEEYADRVLDIFLGQDDPTTWPDSRYYPDARLSR